MPARDGDGFVVCSCGQPHWGLFGAAGLLLVRPTETSATVLLQLRASWTHGGGTWGLPGGALDSHEDHTTAALREAWEEAGIEATCVVVHDVYLDDHGDWSYATVIAHATPDVAAHAANAESDDLQWVPIDEVAAYPLHPGLAASWPVLEQRTLASLTARPG